jgi:hypothetical protein
VARLENRSRAERRQDRVRGEVAGQCCSDDHRAPHGGLTALDVVVHEIVSDELAVPMPDQ